jgi:hypothetical protein
MESGSHLANSSEKYRVYFELLHGKMAEYDVVPGNTYNMGEKGFAIGVSGRSKWIFEKLLYHQSNLGTASLIVIASG